jgi:hypothetical protein
VCGVVCIACSHPGLTVQVVFCSLEGTPLSCSRGLLPSQLPLPCLPCPSLDKNGSSRPCRGSTACLCLPLLPRLRSLTQTQTRSSQ